MCLILRPSLPQGRVSILLMIQEQNVTSFEVQTAFENHTEMADLPHTGLPTEERPPFNEKEGGTCCH